MATTTAGRKLSIRSKKTGTLLVGDKKYAVYVGRKHPDGYVRLDTPAYLRSRDSSLKHRIWIREEEAPEAADHIFPHTPVALS